MDDPKDKPITDRDNFPSNGADATSEERQRAFRLICGHELFHAGYQSAIRDVLTAVSIVIAFVFLFRMIGRQ